jgi:TRAP-type C4-dicarboxylate transport system substrate-binding protein
MNRVFLVALACATLFVSAVPAPAADITVKIADHFPAGHVIPSTLTKPWMARVEELSGKKVKFTHFPAQQLVKQVEALGAVQRKVVDIALINPGLFPTEFALTGVTFLPNGYDSVVHGGKALQRLYQHKAVLDELKKAGVKVLLIEPLDSYESMTDRPVKTPADLRGLKVRAAGEAQVAAARALGATPVTMAAPEMYTGMQRRTLDGLLFAYSVGRSYKLNEVVKHGTIGANTGYANVIYAVNESVWNAWPAEVRDAMTKAADEIHARAWAELDKATAESIEAFRKGGVTITDVAKTGSRKEWVDALRPVREQWASGMKARGLAGPDVLEAWDKALADTK